MICKFYRYFAAGIIVYMSVCLYVCLPISVSVTESGCASGENRDCLDAPYSGRGREGEDE